MTGTADFTLELGADVFGQLLRTAHDLGGPRILLMAPHDDALHLQSFEVHSVEGFVLKCVAESELITDRSGWRQSQKVRLQVNLTWGLRNGSLWIEDVALEPSCLPSLRSAGFALQLDSVTEEVQYKLASLLEGPLGLPWGLQDPYLSPDGSLSMNLKTPRVGGSKSLPADDLQSAAMKIRLSVSGVRKLVRRSVLAIQPSLSWSEVKVSLSEGGLTIQLPSGRAKETLKLRVIQQGSRARFAVEGGPLSTRIARTALGRWCAGASPRAHEPATLAVKEEARDELHGMRTELLFLPSGIEISKEGIVVAFGCRTRRRRFARPVALREVSGEGSDTLLVYEASDGEVVEMPLSHARAAVASGGLQVVQLKMDEALTGGQVLSQEAVGRLSAFGVVELVEG